MELHTLKLRDITSQSSIKILAMPTMGEHSVSARNGLKNHALYPRTMWLTLQQLGHVL